MKTETFILRIWQESGRSGWHGQILHLPDQHHIYFASFEQIKLFLADYIPSILFHSDENHENEE
ncbi:MAG: hypothetical protein N3D16_03310 [Anaerolineales bacterium]|nr:hypothetical protein [Anaerolineales bacterium]